MSLVVLSVTTVPAKDTHLHVLTVAVCSWLATGPCHPVWLQQRPRAPLLAEVHTSHESNSAGVCSLLPGSHKTQIASGQLLVGPLSMHTSPSFKFTH